MGRYRTAWHLMAATFIDEHRPRAIELETEIRLSKQPQHVDMLLLRKGDGPFDDATAFFKLWRLMGPVALLEYKSRGRPPRPGVLHQLLGYAHLYARTRQPQQPAASLSLFLLVPTMTPTIRRDAELLGLELGPDEGTYVPVIGTLFPTWVVPLNALADEEGEPLIGELGSRTVGEEDRASLQWLAHFYMANEDRARNLEGFEELEARFMKSPSFQRLVRQSEFAQQRYLAGEAAVLLRLLRRRFGDLPEGLEQRVRNADSDRLLGWADRVLDAQTLDDVFDQDD